MSAVAAVLFCLEDETIYGFMRLTCCYNHVLQLSDHVDEFLDLLDLAEWMTPDVNQNVHFSPRGFYHCPPVPSPSLE